MGKQSIVPGKGFLQTLRKSVGIGSASLTARIFWSFVPVVLILWLIVGFLSIYQEHKILRQEFMKRTRTTAESLAYSSELGVFAEDEALLAASLRSVTRDPDLSYTLIYGDKNRLLAVDSKSVTLPMSELTQDLGNRTVGDQGVIDNIVTRDGVRYLEIIVPIVKQQRVTADEFLVGSLVPEAEARSIGAVRLGFSLENLEAHIYRMVMLWVGITAVLLFVSGGSVYALSNRITGPVQRLTVQARKIASGVLDDAIPVESRDEIGQLAHTFNDMSRSLRASLLENEKIVNELHQLNETLENRVQERTMELHERTIELEERSGELQRSLTEFQAMGEISRAVSSSLNVQEVLNTISRYAATLSDSDGCAIFEYDAARKAVKVAASYNLSRKFVKQMERLSITEEDASIYRPFQLHELEEAVHFRYRDPALQEGYRAALVVPMGVESFARGAVVFRRNAGPFNYRVVDLLTTLAHQSKVAIDNARYVQEIQAREIELEQASRHKSQFLANMSHELRTPLNAILGYTELIRDGLYGETPSSVQDVLSRVEHNGRHLLGLINTVLDLSKIEAGKLPFRVDAYSMSDVLQSMISSMDSLAKEKGLELKVIAPPELPVGYGDASRLAQVVMNLVGNAVKFTEHGSVTVSCEAVGPDFLISVRDTGPGISTDQKEAIFEEFRQIDSSSTREKGGSGLGLAISKKLVELQGGRIWVESVVGNGSTFWVRLPIDVSELEKRSCDVPNLDR